MAYPVIYSATETVFTHNGLGVLNECKSCIVTEELNGLYELSLEYPFDAQGKWLRLIENNIIVVKGQRFRIYRKSKDLDRIKVNARHIFYDLLDNFIEYLSLTSVNRVTALDSALTNTQYAHSFTSAGDGSNTGDLLFEMLNPVEAIMGNGGIIDTLGGELQRDNHSIHLHSTIGADRGVLVSYGKNIIGIEEDLDISDLCTRLLPTGKDGLMLSPKYVDSEYIGNYPYPKIKNKEFSSIDDAIDLLAASENYFATSLCDIPIANYKIDFIELTKTEEYKNYAVLESVALGDTVTVRHIKLNIDLKLKVIKVVKNILTGRIDEIELGKTKENFASSINSSIQEVKTKVNNYTDSYNVAIQNATDLITGQAGGYVLFEMDEAGKPTAILIMNHDTLAASDKIWKWSMGGLGFSSNYGATYTTAITQDGSIVADFMTTGTLNADLIKAGFLKSVNNATWINMANGTFNFGNMISFDGTTFSIDLQDKLGGNNLIWNSSADMSFESPQICIFRKIPNGANFDYKWIRTTADTGSADSGNFNKISPYTLTTWFSKPSNYKKWDFWKIASGDTGLPSGAQVGDIFFTYNNNSGYSAGDWEKDNGDEKAKFVINDYYGPAPKIDITAQTDKKMVAYYSTGTPSGHTEAINSADNPTLNAYVGDLWWDYDAAPATINVPSSWRGTAGTSLDTSNGYPSGNAFKITAGATDEYFYSEEYGDLKPSTEYTFQGLIKTVITSGSGAQFVVQEYNSSGGIVAEHATALQASTLGYTAYFNTFTSNVAARYFRIRMVVKAGAGYALFDLLKLEQGGNATPWECSSNELKTGSFEVSDKYAKFISADGSYTMFDPGDSGITFHKAGSKKNYHYLVESGYGTTPTGGGSVTVTLTDTLFKGKDFDVTVALKDLNGEMNFPNAIATASVSVTDIDTNNGKFTVEGSNSRIDVGDAGRDDGAVTFQYVAIY
jgi:phage minor structural protein